MTACCLNRTGVYAWGEHDMLKKLSVWQAALRGETTLKIAIFGVYSIDKNAVPRDGRLGCKSSYFVGRIFEGVYGSRQGLHVEFYASLGNRGL